MIKFGVILIGSLLLTSIAHTLKLPTWTVFIVGGVFGWYSVDIVRWLENFKK